MQLSLLSDVFLPVFAVLEPFTLTFVNNTPRIEDSRISVDFITSRPMSFASCLLRNDQLKVNKNCKQKYVLIVTVFMQGIFKIQARPEVFSSPNYCPATTYLELRQGIESE